VHAAPFAFFARQVPPAPLQYVPLAQSLSSLHVLAQAPLVHMNGAQAVVPAVQLPPLQVPASLRVAVFWQTACEQLVPSEYFWQPPAPSQRPFVPHVVAPWSLQVPFGSTEPAIMGEQVPRLPGTLQARHEGQLEVVQQTPSTQLPELHCVLPVHAAPAPFLATQLPPAPVQ
jgi:hypothetical protein